MTTPQDVLARARADLGYKESPAGSNRTKFGRWYGLDPAPWCAMAVSKWFHDAGLPLPASTTKGFAYTPSGVNWFRNQGRYDTRARVGSLVFFQFPGSNRVNHVGIVESIGPTGVLATIEANTSITSNEDGGAVMQRSRRSYVHGYGHPAYEDRPPPPPPSPPVWANPPTKEQIMALPVLRPGAQGHEVRILQGLLAAHAADLVAWFSGGYERTAAFIDGDFGMTTAAVLQEWQRRTTVLAPDAVAGPAVWSWLTGVR